jgi:hypothetical protein
MSKIKLTEQSIPYILIDKILQHTELVRRPHMPLEIKIGLLLILIVIIIGIILIMINEIRNMT